MTDIVPGQNPLKPQVFETLAQSYAILIKAGDIEIETIVEEMIKAKGFEECVAIISGDNINVIVKSEGLLTSEVAQITDIVRNETGFGAENIRIVEKM